MKTFAFASTLLAALPLLARAADQAAKAQAVRNAITNVQKIDALEDGDFVFNFNDPNVKVTKGDGGKLISANVGNFAALVGNGLALTLGFMEGCGINSPHTHPRATEVLLLLNGTITAGFLAENGARFVMNEVHEYNAMVFPAGSVHFQANMGCDPVHFVAALSDEDPGTLQIAQRFFSLPPAVVGATLGGLGMQDVSDLAAKIPDNMIAGVDECRQRCGITAPSTPPATPPPATPPPATILPKMIEVNVGPDNGITYSMDDIAANVGDKIRFNFITKNHTVTQSTFDAPCSPMNGGFNSDFRPVAAGPQPPFEIEIKNTDPVWFYCMQGTHCINGMLGGINAPQSGDKTVAKFKEAAAKLAAPPAPAPPAEPKVHDVTVGQDLGLTFTSNDIMADVGDIVRFHFVSKNHTVTRSAFDAPCMPITGADAFDSGFLPVPPNTPEKTFDVQVKDANPIWFYCAQPATGNPTHCQAGMVGAINAPKDGDKTLAAFIERAKTP